MQRAGNKSPIILLAVLFFFTACSSVGIDIIQTGPYFPPKKPKDIELYQDRNSVKKSFGGIAIIHSERFNCDVSIQKKILNKARKAAALAGANGIIYYFNFDANTINSDLKEKCFFSGLAIKYIDDEVKLSTQAI
ncbi:MAG: hypothetical protein K6357_05365 [Elusimicrobiota bacterium]